MIQAKTVGLLGGLRATGGKAIVHQARFIRVKLTAVIGPGLAMVAASAVLGHMHSNRCLKTRHGRLASA